MAYQGNNNNQNKSSFGNRGGFQKQQQTGTTSARPALFTTGLFKPEKGAAIGSVKTKEAVTIPAGSYINLYEVENKVEGKPVFRIQVREASKKA